MDDTNTSLPVRIVRDASIRLCGYTATAHVKASFYFYYSYEEAFLYLCVAGLDEVRGWAFGMGLDRLVMLVCQVSVCVSC